MNDILWMDATEQAERIRSGELSARELVEAAAARMDAVNPTLNAIVTPLIERAIAQAAKPNGPDLPDGPFRGVPFLTADHICQVESVPHYAGMQLLKNINWIAPRTSDLMTRFEHCGFVLMGTTNVSELGLIPTAESVAHGATCNPWDLNRSPGGACGGSAAGVAAGLVSAAHCGGSWGAVRIPAGACGLVGLKPTRGRIEPWQLLGVEEFVVTRSVRDSAAIFDALTLSNDSDVNGGGGQTGTLRIGVMTHAPGGIATTHPACVAAVKDVGRLLESLGHTVESTFPKALDSPEFGTALLTIVAAKTARTLDAWGQQIGQTGRSIGADDVEPITWAVTETGRAIPATDYIGAAERLQQFSREVLQFWDNGFDLLLTPTQAELPPQLGRFATPSDNPMSEFFLSAPQVAFALPFNVTGQPAISLPLQWTEESLPTGIQLVAAPGREDILFRVASQLEEARPWSNRRPKLT